MLGQRRRRWANINPAIGQRVVFAGSAPGKQSQTHLLQVYKDTDNQERWPNVGLVLGQRRRRWASVVDGGPTSGQH